MKINLTDQELKRINRVSFIGLIAIAFIYVFLATTAFRDYAVYAFFVDYAVFLFATTVLDRRKKQQAKVNQTARGELYSTLSGAGLLFIGVFGLLIGALFIFSLL